MTPRPDRVLAGRAAIVTGSVGSGIGRSVALRLARAGADIVLNYGTSGRQLDRTAAIAQITEAIAGFGSRAIAVAADTRTPDGVNTLIAQARQAFGDIDILVNNAGAPWLEEDFAAASFERWRDTLAAEVLGPAQLTAALLPAMRNNRWGRIVNIVIDFRTFEFLLDASYRHRLSQAPYPSWIGKQGRLEMVEQLAHAELRYGVTVNAILPGIIEEFSWEAAVAAACQDPAEPALLASPDHVAQIVARLCGDEFRWVTGSRIVVPGNLYERIR